MTTPPRKRNTQKRKSKKHLHTNLKKFKDHRNLVSVFLKRGKSSYQGLYYNNNWNNIKSTWEDTKLVFSVKNNASDITII